MASFAAGSAAGPGGTGEVALACVRDSSAILRVNDSGTGGSFCCANAS
jgi:hypothetical protein